ncbi:MAG: GEVED domain-containing protein [Acidobacteriota bacterium]
MVTDLLPVDLIYTPASFTYLANGTGLSAPNLEVLDNYDGTGRTLLRWTWPAASGSLAPNQEPRLEFDTTVRSGAAIGPLLNEFGIQHNDPGLGQRCGTTASSTDVNDLDGDSDRTDSRCTNDQTADIAPIAQLVSNKQVQALCDSDFTSTSNGTLIGGELLYRLEVRNAGTVPMEDFVLVDILPAVGDTGVLDLNPRGSQWTPLLTAAVTPPPGTTVFYSTSQNPCRPEVGGPTTSCDPPNWTTVAPTPITAVRSFKIEFGDRVLAPADALQFSFRLTAPGDAPTAGEEAFNSFAYLAERADGLGSLSAEPNRVGTAIGTCEAAALGDRVWIDTNGDGLQNDGATGLNDVFVELFTPGTDGLPGTFDDVPVASTVTGTSPLGAPGWYLFPGLAPGSYFVCFDRPPTYFFTAENVGGDDAIDSDVDPATGCSPLVVLAADETNLTVDAGLLPPAPAALGDYVWFDRDADGIQNESPFFGANGVTVRLYGDDGDGTPEPGGDDGSPLAVTATTDDVFGRPGYYLFDGLAPGGSYFVEFVLPAVATGFTSLDAGGDDSVDSDAALATGLGPVVTLAAGEVRLDLDAGLIVPVGDLVLGDQVWCDDDDDGVFEPEDGEEGVDGVELSLYLDQNGDGEPTLDEFIASTLTSTSGGFAGRYRFEELDAADYIVVVELDNFAGGGPLEGKTSSSGNDPTPDPDDDVNGDDNGTDVGALIADRPITLVDGAEPTADDGDSDTNLTLDFGFTDLPTAPPPEFDYGDAPDATAGTAAGDYQTTALDAGAVHPVGVANAPYLGDCVDADNGVAQNIGATADDAGSFGTTVGTCAMPGDDEDGVAIANPLTPGMPTTIDVTASTGTNDCVLDAWIDWNRDGTFAAGEQIATSQTIAAGTTASIPTVVPAIAPPGLTYGRFRCSTAGGLGPDGFALDGEVEDHAVSVTGADLGDAPDTYGTLLASTGAIHTIDPLAALFLGSCVDFEVDGAPSGDALGDDDAIGAQRVGTCLDDEDGIVFMSPVVACESVSIQVTTNGAGRLDAWIDLDGDDDFDATDRIFTNQAVGIGTQTVVTTIPCAALPGSTYARFRLTSAGVADPTGPAPDGEVEDYALSILVNDWGDQTQPPYPTTDGSSGARHVIDPSASFFLGTCVDGEADGQPNADATGDDLAVGSVIVGTCTGGDDEDGVVVPATLDACSTVDLPVTASAAGVLDAWIDFGGDGSWADAGDRIASGTALTAGANTLSVTVPCDAAAGSTGLRFRFSSAGVASATGPAPDGEVEDYRTTIRRLDFGDAPDTYGTVAGSNGARHELGGGIFLGTCVDVEDDAATPLDATGDDAASSPGDGSCSAGDDEDGVTFDTPIAACKEARLTVVSSSASAVLDAWLDFSGDGTFDDPTDRLFDGQALAVGSNALSFTVPCDATDGLTYARFRVAGAGGSPSPVGLVVGGEVEDYAVSAQGVDFGDAPDTYGTSFATDGARHAVDPTTSLYLGACVDTEEDAETPLDATGDDMTTGTTTAGTCTANDDEDGVTFGTPIVACLDADLTITAGAAGVVDAWIDFDGDGAFDPVDQILTSQAVAVGTQTLTVSVPCDATPGTTYARFRLSSTGGLQATGPTFDGEVEDYAVELRGNDFGDAPDSYGTTLGNGGPSHGVIDGYALGAAVDVEVDGQPTIGADGDDLNVTDDEDGVTFPGGDLVLLACGARDLQVSVTDTAGVGTALLDAWIDFDGDGAFDDPRDRVAMAAPLMTGGVTTVSVIVPCDVDTLATYARFRLSSTGVATPTGPTDDGEIEDYAIELRSFDLGDHPEPPYATTLGAGGARHAVLLAGNPTLGAQVDTESDGQPSPSSNGDDGAADDDEDGVVFPAVLVPGTDGAVEIETGPTGGLVSLWIDFDRDGTFVAGERVVANQMQAAGLTETYLFPVPAGSPDGSAPVRARIASQPIAGPNGDADDGEVEDHLAPVGVENPRIGVAKQVIDVANENGLVFRVTYAVEVANFGNVPLSNLDVTVDLATGFADAASFDVVSVVSPTLSVNPAYDGGADLSLLTGVDSLEVGGFGLIELEVRIDTGGEPGPYSCIAIASGESPGGDTVEDESQDGADPDPDDDGDPSNDDDPTLVVFDVNVLEIPTLDALGLALLAIVLALLSLRRLRSSREAIELHSRGD